MRRENKIETAEGQLREKASTIYTFQKENEHGKKTKIFIEKTG